jgi:hypothetical protein
MMGLGNLNNALDVMVGRSYVASRSTPLMPHHSPSNEYLAIARMEEIAEGEVFHVTAEYLKRGYPWFHVECGDRKGWVSGIALVGQDLKEEKPPEVLVAEINEASDEILRNVEEDGHGQA